MSCDIRLYQRFGYWWHGLRVGNRIHLLSKVGRVGDYIRP
jgi:hypothetical protein